MVIFEGYIEVVCPECNGTATLEMREWEDAEECVRCDECDAGWYEPKGENDGI